MAVPRQRNFQRARRSYIVFARAALKSGNVGGGVVVIDEATSRYVIPHFGWWSCCADPDAVSMKRPRKIHNLTVEMLRGKSVVSVLHRLETAVKYDKILVLDEGRVLDLGTPQEVISGCELFSAFRGKEDGGRYHQYLNGEFGMESLLRQ
jgi:hypothetical protein